MNVYDLSYSEYTERLTLLWLKYLKGEEDFMGLYDLLTADGSDFFFTMSGAMSEYVGRAIDFLCYFLLSSVRVTGNNFFECVYTAVEITQEILEEMANEKRE